MTLVPGYKFANWERDYGDVHLVPEMQTLRLAAWPERTTFVIADVVRLDVGAACGQLALKEG